MDAAVSMKNWFRGIFIGSDTEPLEVIPDAVLLQRREREKETIEITEDGMIILSMRGKY